MLNHNEIADMIRGLGLKQYVLSAAVGVHPTLLSRFLNNQIDLSLEQKIRIVNYLTKLKEAVSM